MTFVESLSVCQWWIAARKPRCATACSLVLLWWHPQQEPDLFCRGW